MKPEDVRRIVHELAEKCFKMPVAFDTPIDDQADSLKLSELVIALEQRFDIALEDSAIGRLRVLEDLARLVQRKVEA